MYFIITKPFKPTPIEIKEWGWFIVEMLSSGEGTEITLVHDERKSL